MRKILVLKSSGFAGLGDLLLALDRALLVAQVTGRAPDYRLARHPLQPAIKTFLRNSL